MLVKKIMESLKTVARQGAFTKAQEKQSKYDNDTAAQIERAKLKKEAAEGEEDKNEIKKTKTPWTEPEELGRNDDYYQGEDNELTGQYRIDPLLIQEDGKFYRFVDGTPTELNKYGRELDGSTGKEKKQKNLIK